MAEVVEKVRQNPVEKYGESGMTTMVRLFVGGLGESVTAVDIVKTFSSLGEIKDLDIIRTKGRSFAYMDYLPASETALSKLFSTYNGCAWKGGRLKFERAKEHYLVRMRREWAEDAKFASTPPSNDIDVGKKLNSLKELKKIQKLENKKIRIFIPKLGKVKSLPFYGSGKHKYSFQRIEVPALPAHFCDCEEHSGSSHAVKAKHFLDFEMQSGGMNEEEVGIMNAAMNKLLERKCNVNAASVGTTAAELDELAEQADDSTEDILVDANEADPDDLDDDLIINIVAGENDSMTLQAASRKQELRAAQLQSPPDMKAKNKHGIQESKRDPSNKKIGYVPAEANDGNEMSASIPGKKAKNKPGIQERRNSPSNKKRKILPASVPENKLRSQAADPESNLLHHRKFSWKELVDAGGTNQLSISHILQGSPSNENKQHKVNGSDVPDATERKSSSDLEHETLNLRSKEMAMPEVVQSMKPHGVKTKSVRVSTTSRQNEGLKKHPKEMAGTPLEVVQPAKSNGTENESARATTSSQAEALKRVQHSEKMAKPNVAKPDAAVNKSGSGTDSERQKFSWKQLIQDGNGCSFSIAQITPDISHLEKKEAAKTNFVKASLEQNKKVSFGDQFQGFGLVAKAGSLGAPPRRSNMADDPVWERNKLSSNAGDKMDSASAQSVPEKCSAAAAGKQASPGGGGDGFGERCVFMRSADSMKEWAATKAALTKSLKKKSPEK